MLSAQTADICFLTAAEMAHLIRGRKLSAREVLAAHLKQIERVNPQVNAIVTLTADRATESARSADEAQAHGAPLGPLHGLPVVHKDLFDTAGVRTTYGSRIFRNHVPQQNAIIVEKILLAGAIPLGKSNTPEFGAGSQTFNEVFGATRNPYDLTKTCGGSTGGGAVSLACGMTPLADGSDSGGSLRNPAAFCNVVGIRPAPGRVATAAMGDAWSTLSVHGPMARTAADVALFLSVLAGPDARSPISISEPGSRYTGDLGHNFKGSRIAWFKDMGGIPFDPRILRVVNARLRVFEDLGCIVEQAEPDWTGAWEAYDTLRAWGFAATQSENARRYPELVKDTIHYEVERGARLSAADITRALTLRSRAWNEMRVFQQTYEFFVAPTTQVLPYDVNQPYPTEIEGVKMSSYVDWQRSCILISALETPAISVPCGFTDEGLPVGLQIVGRHRDEWGILQLANAFEQATNAGRRKPEIA
jgi:amidase